MGANLSKLSITHDMIMDWMLQNPGQTLAMCAQEFGYTVAWISMIVNSDLFQERLAQRRQEIDTLVHADIPTRMRGVAAQALEKIARHVSTTEDPDYLLQTADKMLHRLGYAPSKGPVSNAKTVNVQQNVFVASKDSLASARSLMNQVTQLLPPPEVVDDAAVVEPLIFDSFDHVVTTSTTPS